MKQKAVKCVSTCEHAGHRNSSNSTQTGPRSSSGKRKTHITFLWISLYLLFIFWYILSSAFTVPPRLRPWYSFTETITWAIYVDQWPVFAGSHGANATCPCGHNSTAAAFTTISASCFCFYYFMFIIRTHSRNRTCQLPTVIVYRRLWAKQEIRKHIYANKVKGDIVYRGRGRFPKFLKLRRVT